MSRQHPPEPFGFFKAEPFGWTDCEEMDEGARPLFDQDTIDGLTKQRHELLAALLWVLWHHQGGSSPTGQPLRRFLSIGQHDRLTDAQIEQAKTFIGLAKGGAS